MVEAMAPGSVIVDVAAVRGGNCELTQARRNRAYIRASQSWGRSTPCLSAPYHASQMYSANVVTTF